MKKTYMLKPGQEAFDVVDGPHAGKRFKKGVAYDEAGIPPNEKHRFSEIKEAKKAEPAKKPEPAAKIETPSAAGKKGGDK